MISGSTTLHSRLIFSSKVEEVDSAELRRLTEALARGDDAAWSQFHRTYGPLIFRHLLALSRYDHDLAKEAVQRTYLRVAKHVRPCEEKIMFHTWLRTVARTALQDCWRRQRSFASLLVRKKHEELESTGPEEPDRLMEELDHALERLDVADRALLEAKYFSGKDVRTLAADLKITPKAVESRLTRAREALRRKLLVGLHRNE